MTADTPDADDAPERTSRAGSGSGASTAAVETLATVCGCAGKTSLDRVVTPALERIADRVGPGVVVADALDAALLPRTDDLERGVDAVLLDGSRPRFVGDDEQTWTLAGTFADGTIGGSADRFAEVVGRAYAALGDDGAGRPGAAGRVVIGKGHAVQVAGASTGLQVFEHLRPVGARRPGHRAANVDVVHAFPGLPPERQAEIAVLNALNDCYASGAWRDRAVRPVVAVPAGRIPPPGRVRTWYAAAAPADVTVHSPAVLEHDGRGWLFGATATAVGGRTPPVRTAALEPDDAVLVHRPLGGLALFTHAVDVGDDPAAYRRALATLTADHHRIARALTRVLPAPGEPFDPDRHVKLITDVSGSGVAGIGRTLGPSHGLRVTGFPLLDRATLDRARDRWVVPDVTVETNGPLAVVAAPDVATAVADRLAAVGAAAPARLGTVRARGPDGPPVTVADGVPAGRYVEQLAGGGPPR